MAIALGIALCLLGNRAWGSAHPYASHALGGALTAMGLWLQHDYSLLMLALIGTGVFNFRLWSPHAWFATFQRHVWGGAFVRGMAILPLAFLLAIFQHDLGVPHWWTPLLVGIAAVGLVPVAYWGADRLALWFNKRFSAKGWQFTNTELAEELVGAIVGTVGI